MAVAVAGAVVASSTSALAVATVTIQPTAFQNGSGGEFAAIPSADALSGLGTPNLTDYVNSYAAIAQVGSGFRTFCLEKAAHLDFGVPYTYAVSGGAIDGGPGAVGGTDIVSIGTAWLYSQFATGSLAGYFNANRFTNAGLLQDAIWYLEDEHTLTALELATNPFYQAALAAVGALYVKADTDVNGDTAAAYGVYALNLGDSTTRPGFKPQDVLVFKTSVPDGGTTLMLIGIAFGGLTFLRRKLS